MTTGVNAGRGASSIVDLEKELRNGLDSTAEWIEHFRTMDVEKNDPTVTGVIDKWTGPVLLGGGSILAARFAPLAGEFMALAGALYTGIDFLRDLAAADAITTDIPRKNAAILSLTKQLAKKSEEANRSVQIGEVPGTLYTIDVRAAAA